MQLPHTKNKPPPKVIEHEVTLQELYNSATKKVTYSRKKLKSDGLVCTLLNLESAHRSTQSLSQCSAALAQSTMEEIVDQYIGLKPWWKSGRVALFPGAGDEGVDILPGDVEIELLISPDACWSCEGSTLIYMSTISLTEASAMW